MLFRSPLYYLGQRPYPYLNEITTQVVWWYPNASTLQGKAWVGCELVNPYNFSIGGGSLKVMIDRFRYTVTSTNSAWPDYDDGNAGGWNWEQEVTIPTVPANSYTNVIVGFDFNTVPPDDTGIITQAVVRLHKVRLLQTSGNDATICDWASSKDFNLMPTNTFTGVSATYTDSQFLFPKTNALGNATVRASGGGGLPPDWTSAYTCGMAKNDPRVRNFVAWNLPTNAWFRVGFNDGFSTQPATTVGGENTGVVDFNSGTGLSGVPSDPPPASVFTVATHPSFYAKTTGAAATYESIGELGYIHIGLPWRTLMLQPRPAAEIAANLIPDWAVLDMFSVTNQAYVGLVNINSAITNLAATAVRSNLLAALVTGITPTYNMGTFTDQGPIVANIYAMNWATTGANGWRTKRTNPFKFLPNVYNMVGELCEVDSIATNCNPAATFSTDFMREARLRSFANLVTTRSGQFTVWALAQTIQDVNANGTFDAGTDIITAEAKVQAVVERYLENGQVKFRTLYFRYYAE